MHYQYDNFHIGCLPQNTLFAIVMLTLDISMKTNKWSKYCYYVLKTCKIGVEMEQFYHKLLSVFQCKSGHDWSGRQAYLDREPVRKISFFFSILKPINMTKEYEHQMKIEKVVST